MRNKIWIALVLALVLAFSSCEEDKTRVTNITLDVASMDLIVGESANLVAAISPEDADNQKIIWSSENISIVSVNNGIVQAVAPGTTNVIAKADDNSTIFATCKITVNDKATGIIIESETGPVLESETLTIKKEESIRLKASIQPENAAVKTLSWISTNEDIATISDKGEQEVEIKGVKTGETDIIVTAADIGLYATCHIVVVQNAQGLSIEPTAAELYEDETIQLLTAVTPEDASESIIWKSSDEEVATVSEGKVYAKRAGTVDITASIGSGEDALTATCTVTVKCHVKGVNFKDHSLTVKQGQTLQLSATVYPERASNAKVSWSSSNPSVASVSETGMLTAKASGTATITVTTDEGGFKDDCEVTVNSDVTGITLSKSELVLKVKETAQLTATVSPEDATNKTIIWSSSNTSVATVSNGKVTAVASGEAVICATTEEGGHHALCTVTVTDPVTGVSVSPTKLTLNMGESRTIIATIEPANAINKKVNWTSSDSTVATVDNNGKVTAMSKVGMATITATSADNPSKSATCTVTVTDPVIHVTGVSVSPTELILYKGGSSTISAKITPSNAENKNISWDSSNKSVATVNANGTVVAHSVGTTTITVKTEDGGHTASCNVTVKEKPVNVTSITLDKRSFTLSFGGYENIKATIEPANATNKKVIWTSSNPTVAKVENGKVTAMSKEGTVIITATSDDDPSLSATCTVKVVSRFVPVSGLTVSPSSLNIYLGQKKQLTATVSPSDATDNSVVWSVQQGGVAAVNQNGVVTPLKVGSTRVVVRTNDGGYSKSVQVTVKKNDLKSISLPDNKIVLKVGETHDLTVTVKGKDESAPASNPNVTWKSSDQTIATVASFANGGTDASKKTGRITARKAGKITITVTSSDNPGIKETCEVTVLDGGSSGGGNEGVEFDDWNF